jgi:hypothetical protein
MIWQNTFLTHAIDLYPVAFHEFYKRFFLLSKIAAANPDMYVNDPKRKKETNYHSCNCCRLFHPSVACATAFREKKKYYLQPMV